MVSNWNRPKASSAARGYGGLHRRLRREAAARHRASDPCARCGWPLGPMNRTLHYDHAEHGGYLGFSHARCNTRAGSVKANAIRRAAGVAQRQTRWVL